MNIQSTYSQDDKLKCAKVIINRIIFKISQHDYRTIGH